MRLIKLFALVIFIILALLITGCSTPVPLIPHFPEAPATLLESCPKKLETIEGDNVTIVDFTKTVVKNYGTYHECASKYDSWIEWYNTQKKLWDESN
jgi:hypothetical protein